MKVAYDYQAFTMQKYGGISRYFYEMIKYFKMDNSENDITIVSPLLFSNNHYISNNTYVRHYRFLEKYDFRGKQRLNIICNKLILKKSLEKQNFDIFHPTYYDPYFLKYINDKPFVVTVYDMIHEKFSDMFSSTDKTTEYKRLLVQKASKVIAISESTKKDLIEYFDVDASKIEVIYLGNSMFPNNKTQIDLGIHKNYILFVGSRDSYKNFNRFINGISNILNQDSSLSVVCVGGGSFTSEESQDFLDLNITSQIIQYDLDDDSLAYFYKNARLFVFPSLYEGFGIPVLESFACNCPLVCSKVSSLPEIALDAAYYFDPYDEESIKDAVLEVLENESLKDELIKKGQERLLLFSWEKTAKQTKTIYKSILK